MKKFSRFGVKVFAIVLTVLLCVQLGIGVQAATDDQTVAIELEGEGTEESPYLVQNYEDLAYFRDCVNSGISFAGQYVKQCRNIDMENREWLPIGIRGKIFAGIYDGGGHYVENLMVPHRKDEVNYNGFFGFLSGTVANLGIESGNIYGEYCGSFASVGVDSNAAILNCYSKANIYGIHAGGIADQFYGNTVACCWFDGTTNGSLTGLISTGGPVKAYHMYTTDTHPYAPDDVQTTTCDSVTKEQLYSNDFVRQINLSVGLTQSLFANHYGVRLVQWELDAANNVAFSDSVGYLVFFDFVNYYLLPLILAAIILGYAAAFKKTKENIWMKYHRDITAIAIISLIVAVFVDAALIKKGLQAWNLGNGLFVLLIHFLAVWFGVIVIKNSRFKFKTEWIPLAIAIAGISVLELLQFDLIPKYDAGIYYGSLFKAVDLFQVDFLTYIGAFACWKWIHGLVLLIGPLEFLMHGQMIGVYIANMVINAVTMSCMYGVFRNIHPRITPLLATLGSTVLILCPYQLGLFTYLAMDPHLALFAAWLLYSYLKKNTIMVSFCGYLLCFTKVSGAAFYVIFMLTMGIFEVLETEGKSLLRKISNWWQWKKVLLWVFPAAAFLVTMIWGDDLTIQVFYGTFTGTEYGFKKGNELMNTILQSFVFGFRWVFVGIVQISVMVALWERKKYFCAENRKCIQIILGTFLGCMGVVLLLCLYQGDADCPRYTAIMNIFFALALPVTLSMLIEKKRWRHLIAGAVALLLLVQTYWTIDPAIIYTTESVDTGKKQVYKLALPGDTRIGMTIGKHYGPGYEVICDLHTYNLEHSCYDSLIDDVLTEIQPNRGTGIYNLDVMWYEAHIRGNKYPIFWNVRTNNRTYDSNDPDVIYLDNYYDVFTYDICAGNWIFPETFYLLVPARVNPETATQWIISKGYAQTDEICAENIYGTLYAYEFTLQKTE